MKKLTFDDIQREAETFAKNYRKFHNVPPLPSTRELKKYKDVLNTKYAQVVKLVKQHLELVDSEEGHGYDHLEDVATRAAFIAEDECRVKNISNPQKEEIINYSLLAGLLHDIERHLGFGEDHMIQGENIARKILFDAGLGSDIILTVVRNHDHMDFNPADDSVLGVVFGSVFDADHFRYGLEREDTFWRMEQKKGKTPSDAIHDYQFLPAFLHAWKTSYGRRNGPKYVEFGLAIAKHVKEVFRWPRGMSKVIVGIITRKNTSDEDEYLLISATKDFAKYTGLYYPPGGHIEEGENKELALKREIKEELNLDIEPIKELAETEGDIEDQITYWWLCEIMGGELKIDTSEIKDAKFFTKEDIQELPMWPATKKFFDKHIFV